MEILPPKATLAVDLMGGDHAPHMAVSGLLEAARLHPTVTFLAFGDAAQIEPLLEADPKRRDQIDLRHTPVKLPSAEKPRNALKGEYQDSSLACAIRATGEGEAAAAVSAADTGAIMALGMRYLGLFPGIDRPAVASYMPTLKNEAVFLDLGANLNVGAKNLHQFGILGTALSEAMLAMTHPRVGLLNIGTEDRKGQPYVREADELMRAHSWPGSYVGFVEPDDLIRGEVDVLVCDGYAGNIMLKSIEASATLIGGYTRATFQESWISRLGYAFAGRQFAKLRRRTDPRRYNGAVMAGLQQVCVKSHGGADSVSFTNALELAIDMANNGYRERVPELLAATNQS